MRAVCGAQDLPRVRGCLGIQARPLAQPLSVEPGVNQAEFDPGRKRLGERETRGVL